MNTTTAPIAAKIKNVGSKKKKIAKIPPKTTTSSKYRFRNQNYEHGSADRRYFVHKFYALCAYLLRGFLLLHYPPAQ